MSSLGPKRGRQLMASGKTIARPFERVLVGHPLNMLINVTTPTSLKLNSSYHCQARRSAQAGYVARRRFSKVSAIFATELRRAFVTHAEGGSCDVDVLDQHQAARLLQPELLLKL